MVRFDYEAEEPAEGERDFRGAGRVTFWDEDMTCHVEIFGSVRELSPLFDQAAAALRARLAELPNE
jgi:hypothetical protein